MDLLDRGRGEFLALCGWQPSSAQSCSSVFDGGIVRALDRGPVVDLPTCRHIVSDLFGIHPDTAHTWANYAKDSWTDYLAARESVPETNVRENSGSSAT